MQQLAANVFLQRHPLKMVGCEMGRNVTVIRLSSGKLLVHSTADFSADDQRAIAELGEPGWLMEATCFHDTCSIAGRRAFADIPYLVPPGFPHFEEVRASPIVPAPDEWAGEIDVIPLGGMPKICEHAIFHRSSKTLIIADLLFYLPASVSWWTRTFLRFASGIKSYPGMSRLLKFYIRDRAAFLESLERIAALDFEQIVVAHGNPITENARQTFVETMAANGFALAFTYD